MRGFLVVLKVFIFDEFQTTTIEWFFIVIAIQLKGEGKS